MFYKESAAGDEREEGHVKPQDLTLKDPSVWIFFEENEMSKFECPLCHQAVSQALYEKITGVWKEKEKKLLELKQKEQNLVKKEKLLKEKIAKEKKIMSEKFAATLNAERTKLQKEIRQIHNKFKNRLAKEVNSALKSQSMEFKSKEIYLKEQLKISGRKAVESAQKKLSQQKAQIEKEKET